MENKHTIFKDTTPHWMRPGGPGASTGAVAATFTSYHRDSVLIDTVEGYTVLGTKPKWQGKRTVLELNAAQARELAYWLLKVTQESKP